MIPWQPTSHGRIEVRPAYGKIPVAPGLHIVGWEVRVWWTGHGGGSCEACKKRVLHRKIKTSTAIRRPDYWLLRHANTDDYVWVPYAHECSSPVPWASRSKWPSEGWQQPHHHPRAFMLRTEMAGVHDANATPILYANAQLAYAGGLELLGVEVPARMHWKSEAR